MVGARLETGLLKLTSFLPVPATESIDLIGVCASPKQERDNWPSGIGCATERGGSLTHCKEPEGQRGHVYLGEARVSGRKTSASGDSGKQTEVTSPRTFWHCSPKVSSDHRHHPPRVQLWDPWCLSDF